MFKKGFTLVELLAIIVILAVIALIATPIVKDSIANSKEQALKETINSIERAAYNYGYQNDIGYDIGSNTIKLYCDKIKDAKRIIVNGPMGLFEKEEYANGTKKIYECITENNIKTIVGGGDSASSVNNLGFAGKFYHISTGGGATLEYLSGNTLPGISVIEDEEENMH